MGAHALRERVFRANTALAGTGLVIETFGNVSGADHEAGLMAIKPSGVPYQKLSTADMVLVSIETGEVVDSTLRPSSDTPTHLELYRAFRCGGIVHTHSKFVAAFAQAQTPIRCLNTTHADYFRGDVPVTRPMTEAEVITDYERNTGLVIVETFRTLSLSPDEVGAVLGKVKVLSFGAGAIGTYIGGSLALAGHQVVFVEQPKVVEELRQRGMRLDLTLDERRNMKEASRLDPSAFVIVFSLEDAFRYGPFDVALFALKSFDTQAALEGLKPVADKIPPILCLSNGVDNEPMIADVLGKDKVIYGTVTSAIGRRSAGDIVLEKLRGMGVAKGHPLSEKLNDALNKAYLNSRLFDDAASMKWSKMLTNLIANPTSAILDMTAGEVFANRDLYKIEIDMLKECLAVMKAQGLEALSNQLIDCRHTINARKYEVFWLIAPDGAKEGWGVSQAPNPCKHFSTIYRRLIEWP